MGMVSAADADGDDLTYSITTTQTNFDIGASTGEITVAESAALDFETTSSYTLEVQASDGTNTATADVVVNILQPNYDTDEDGLIEITTLEQLNAIRWDLDGNGEVDETDNAVGYEAAFPDAATFTTTPTGYELVANLDFSEAASYASGTVDKGWSEAEAGEGWMPIGYYVDETDNAAFVSTFSGNGNTLSNLYVNRGSADYYIGLFGLVGASGIIRDIGLLNVNVTGGLNVGGLVGTNWNAGTGAVMLTACYATGDVTGAFYTGGLVGRNDNSSSGTVTVTDSYYDSETTGQSDTGKGTPQTTAELQGPTGYMGIYADWNVNTDGATGADDPWDFGTTSQYPVLKVDFNGDGSTSDDVTRQRVFFVK